MMNHEETDRAILLSVKLDSIGVDALQAGKAAGSWVFDGNTSTETYAYVLRGFEDGDPEIMDMCPAPLSGEWADSPTPDSLRKEYALYNDDEVDRACDRYEEKYQEGFWDEVERAARYQLEDISDDV